jgi:uncharacterized protein YjiS (DUF1127 family)
MTQRTTTVNLCLPQAKPPVSGAILRFLLRVEAWLDARASRRALYRMDERALADIGLTNADVGRDDPAACWQGLLLPSSKR